MKAIFLNGNADMVMRVYTEKQREKMKELMSISDHVYTLEDARQDESVRDTDVIFSTWGFPAMQIEEIESVFPALKAIYYAAGSVQMFAKPFLDKGVRLFSAWHANGVPVAEYAVAQIVLAAKGYFRLAAMTRTDRMEAAKIINYYPGIFDIKVGLLGLGAIGTMVAERLKAYDVEVYAYDPFASDEKFERLNVRRADMAEIFASCDIVSNHLANRPATQGIIKREHLLSMRDYSTFINTGRGAQLNEADLHDLLTIKPSVTALLDVLTNEEYSDTNPLNKLENCFITPHIAGSTGKEVNRMAQYMIDAFEKVSRGEAVNCEVTMGMLETMA